MKLLLAENYDNRDVTGWYASEKLDGCRAIWDGSKLTTKSGREIHAPEWFTAALPQITLDGELYIGRGWLEEIAAIIRRKKPRDEDWQIVKYHIFDVPEYIGSLVDRMKSISEAIDSIAHCALIEQTKIESMDQVHQMFFYVTRFLGEGIMLRKENAGHTDTLLKLKARQHSEGICIAKNPETITISWRGVQFNLTTRKAEIGDKVTFSYRGTTSKGIPREAGFAAVRDYE